MPTPRYAGTAADLGSGEILGALEGEPLIVVDGTATAVEVPPLLPAVVVAAGGEPEVPPAWADVALTVEESPPRPWVSVPDLAAELDALAARIRTAPVAAVTLAQVLRSSKPGDAEHDLAVESLAYSVLQAGAEFSAWGKARIRRQRASGGDSPVLVAREGDHVTITLNRPEVHNAYSAAMRDALCEALALVAEDDEVRQVDLRGAGPSFCSGGDLEEFGSAPDPATAHLVRTTRSAARLMIALADRTTVHLHGACAGAGIELPAFAARVVAQEDSRIWLPEVAMGLIPGAGGTASLPRRIGRHRTAWLALSGRIIDAATARGWGLVDELG